MCFWSEHWHLFNCWVRSCIGLGDGWGYVVVIECIVLGCVFGGCGRYVSFLFPDMNGMRAMTSHLLSSSWDGKTDHFNYSRFHYTCEEEEGEGVMDDTFTLRLGHCGGVLTNFAYRLLMHLGVVVSLLLECWNKTWISPFQNMVIPKSIKIDQHMF